MYRKFFGLTSLPFKITPDLGVFYTHGSREDILAALVYAVTRGDGILKVTGEVGCGKTMLLRLLADSLPDEFSIVYINSPNLSARDMLLYICSELDIPVDQSMLKFTLLNLLTNELLKLHAEGKRVVMLIDEAQAMTFDTLEEIRLLSNVETSDDKLLQIVLFGQPELDVALENEKIRQLKSRISYSIYIPPLNPNEVNSYLNYRMRKSNYEGLDIFDQKVSGHIHKLSEGLPRTINTIADKLLMSAYSTGDRFVTKKHIKMLPELDSLSTSSTRYFQPVYIVISVAILLSLLIGYLYFSNDFIQEEYRSKEIMVVTPEVFDPTVNRLNQPQVTKSTNKALSSIPSDLSVSDYYSVEDHNAIINNPELLKKLLSYHVQAKEWLSNSEQGGYVIQLSSSSLDSLDKTVNYYHNSEITTEFIHILIDSSSNDKKFRLKVFYLASHSYPELTEVLENLPKKMKTSQPYITTVKQLSKNLKYTDSKLKLHGIVNVHN